MQKSKHLWRGLFFITLIIALCGGLALPVVNTPARAAPQMQAATNIVISEFRTRGPNGGNDEFIELYNPTSSPIDISGWKINGSNSAGTAGTRATIPSSIILEPGQYYLVANNGSSGYSGSVNANLTYSSGITDDGGIALLTSTDQIVDEVGMDPGSLYQEGAILSPLTGSTNQSYERLLGAASDSCQDTNDNAADFANISPSAPQNLLSPLSLCGVILPTLTPTNTSTVTSTSTATGTPTNTGTVTNTPTVTAPSTGSATSIVISEFRTRGTGSAENEFVEIYNPTTNPVDISNWILSASNIGGTIQNRATVPVGTLLRSGQYYLFAHNSYITPSGGVSPNLRYGTSITNDGGVAILNASGDIIDQVGMSEGSFYQEGATLPAFTGSSNGSYERLDGGDLDSCVDTDDNESDFQDSDSGTLHNYSSPLSLCGTDRPALISTTTLITGDTPDPSNINGNVAVSVRVTGSSLSPSGSRVYITGANTNCTITLNSSGTGSCLVKFTTNGTKIITATYLGDNTHQGSSDTETHQVGTSSAIRTPTRVPTAIPPPPLIGINEFVPRPGHDWNNDGVINTGDEYIELINHGVIDVDLSGYSLDDEVNIGSAPFRLSSIILKPGERRVFYGSETGLLLSDGGDGVRLLKPNGQLGDAYNYRVVRFPDQSYCRLPDNGGLDDWNQNCFPTPGLQNSLSGSTVNPPTSGDAENLCPIADTLPADFVFAECLPFGNNIWNPAYWDRNGWYGERNLPQSPGKWNVFVD